ncbi:MAG: YcxB family protein [Thermoguttaceae bacterium]|jgi:hypothetical protein
MTDSREVEQNPYQSPSEDASLEGLARTKPSFRLREPICVEGTASAEDIREAMAVVRGAPFTLFHYVLIFAIGVIGAPAVFVLKEDRSPMVLGIALSCVLAVVSLGLLVYVAIPRWRARKNQRECESDALHQRITITDETIAVASDKDSSIWSWAQFAGHRRTDRVVVLLFRFSALGLMVPKSFFTDETLWETFVTLVQDKLPERQRGGAVRQDEEKGANAGVDVGVATALADRGGPSQGEVICAEGVLSPDEVRQAAWIVEGLSWRRLSPFVPLAGVALIVVLAIRIDAFELALLIPLGLVVGFVVAHGCIVPRRTLRQQWRKRQGIFEPQRLVVSDDCLTVSTPTVAGTLQWSGIARYVHRKDLLILHLENGSYRVIPKSFFPRPGDWDTLLRLVQENAGGWNRGQERPSAVTGRYYTINLRHASIREICRYCPTLRDRMICIAKKLLRIDMLNGCFADGDTMRFWPANVRPKRVPEAVQERLEECVGEALAIHCFHSSAGLERLIYYGAVLLPSHRRFWGQLVWSWSDKCEQRVVRPMFVCTSVMANGALLTTAGCQRTFDLPPDFDVEYQGQATVRQIVERHETRLQLSRLGWTTIADPVDAIRNAVNRKLKYHASKGMLVELDRSELQQFDDSPYAVDHGVCEIDPPGQD